MREQNTELKPLHFYHIYNRAIGKEKLFREERNYQFFLKKWSTYLNEYLDVWAYCLIPNHFHFLVRIKGKENIDLTGFENLSGLITQKFSNFFNSYTKSYNKIYNRNGSLFQRPFKRVEVDSQNYLQHLIHYIHHNPIHHNLVQNYSVWQFSSYSSILSNRQTELERNAVLELFGNRQEFKSYHTQRKNYNQISHLIPE